MIPRLIQTVLVLLVFTSTIRSAPYSSIGVAADVCVKLKERDRLSIQANLLMALGKHAEVLVVGEKILALERAVFGPANERVRQALGTMGRVHRKREDFDAAMRTQQEIIDLTIREHGPEHWEVRNEQLTLERVRLEARLTPGQRAELERADQAYRQGQKLLKVRDYDNAQKLLEQSAETYKRLLGDKNSFYAGVLGNLALLHKRRGDLVKLEPILREYLEIGRFTIGEQHPYYGNALHLLGGLYADLGDYAKAEPLCRQAVANLLLSLGEENSDYGMALGCLMRLYLDQKEYAKAEHLLPQILKTYRQAKDDLSYARNLVNLGLIYLARGKVDQAEPVLLQALEACRQQVGEDHPDYVVSLRVLSTLHWSRGDYAKTEVVLRQVLDVLRRTRGERDRDYALGLHHLGMVCYLQGEAAKAEPRHQAAR